jgi:CRP/FNR family transcriptional regulator
MENRFEMPNLLTHEDIASLIASSRQTVTSVLNQFISDGLIQFSRQVITIPDVNKLQKRITVV